MHGRSSLDRRFSRRSLIRSAALTTGASIVAAPAIISSRAMAATSFPGKQWLTATPASVGMSTAKLQEAQAVATRYSGGAGCVIRHGKVVYTWGSFTDRYLIQSATKSWGSVWLGLAHDDGKIALKGKVQTYLPNLGYKPSTNAATGWLDDITVEQLATHTGGFPQPSGYSQLQAKPGTTFIYSNCGTNWLANAITNIYHRDLRPLSSLRIFHPLGLTSNDITWRTPPIYFKDLVYGVVATEFNGGMLGNVNAMARLGYLYLNRGNWNGTQVVSSGWVDLSTKPYYPQLPITGLTNYGLLWWNNGNGWLKGCPKDAFFATGLNNNHVFVVPSLDLVAVRLGIDGWSNHGGNHAQFLKPVTDAVVNPLA